MFVLAMERSRRDRFAGPAGYGRGSVLWPVQQFPVAIAAKSHPFPSRTRKLSSPAPMVLGGSPPGRVGRRRNNRTKAPHRVIWCGAFARPFIGGNAASKGGAGLRRGTGSQPVASKSYVRRRPAPRRLPRGARSASASRLRWPARRVPRPPHRLRWPARTGVPLRGSPPPGRPRGRGPRGWRRLWPFLPGRWRFAFGWCTQRRGPTVPAPRWSGPAAPRPGRAGPGRWRVPPGRQRNRPARPRSRQPAAGGSGGGAPGGEAPGRRPSIRQR
jgi:hypothetical protein